MVVTDAEVFLNLAGYKKFEPSFFCKSCLIFADDWEMITSFQSFETLWLLGLNRVMDFTGNG